MMSTLQYLLRGVQVAWIALRQLAGLGLDHLLHRPGPGGAERLKTAFEQMGGSFLKFGQILSLQIDQLPKAYCDALLDLLDRVPPFSPEKVKQVFREELGRHPEVLYKEFDYRPLASASIGQVHRAVLPDSTLVAVKVQRPGIRDVFERDAKLLNQFIRLVFLFRIRTVYFLRDPVREFNLWIQEELDYQREATHAAVLEENARQTPTESVPKIHWSLTTPRVMTMDFLQGYTVVEYVRMRDQGEEQKLEELKALNFDPAVFVSNVITNFMSDALRFGVFHADLHPANLLILKDNQVGYVDFGIVGTLSPEGRHKIIQLTLAYVGGRNEEIFTSFLEVCELTERADLRGFRQELEQYTRGWYQEPAIGGIPRLATTLNQAMIDLLTLCRSYGLLPRREVIRYIRSVVLADGLVSRLAPGLDYGPELQHLCEDYLASELRQKTLSTGTALTLLADFTGWLQTGPDTLLRTLDQLEKRQLPIRVEPLDRSDRRRPSYTRTAWIFSIWAATLAWVAWRWSDLIQDLAATPSLITFSFFLICSILLVFFARSLRQS